MRLLEEQVYATNVSRANVLDTYARNVGSCSPPRYNR